MQAWNRPHKWHRGVKCSQSMTEVEQQTQCVISLGQCVRYTVQGFERESVLDTLLYTWRFDKAETFETSALQMATEHVQ